MSISTHVVGIRPPDEKWLRMKAVWDACKEAGVEIPDDVLDFFDSTEPNPSGFIVDLQRYGGKGVQEWSNDYSKGIEVYIDDLPKDVKIVRFYNSW